MSRKIRSTGRVSLGNIGEELLAKTEQADNIHHCCSNQEMECFQAYEDLTLEFCEASREIGEVMKMAVGLKKEIRRVKG